MTEMTREDLIEMKVAGGMSRTAAESYYAELDHGAEQVTDADAEAIEADLRERRPELF